MKTISDMQEVCVYRVDDEDTLGKLHDTLSKYLKINPTHRDRTFELGWFSGGYGIRIKIKTPTKQQQEYINQLYDKYVNYCNLRQELKGINYNNDDECDYCEVVLNE